MCAPNGTGHVEAEAGAGCSKQCMHRELSMLRVWLLRGNEGRALSAALGLHMPSMHAGVGQS